MAKGNLFLSQARGKLGSVVFYRANGEQVSRVYTNQIKNPRTTGQNEQRAIFYTVQRYAAGAKYLIEQGQEGITDKTLARRAFIKQALAAVRSAYIAGDNLVLNAKSNPYLQPVPLSLTHGNLPQVNYGYVNIGEAAGVNDPWPNLLTNNGSPVIPTQSMTVADLFAAVPSLGLGKQLTAVWLTTQRSDEGEYLPNMGLNYRTELHYSEIVFSSDAEILTKPAFVVNPDDSTVIVNPEVLTPSWGGTDSFPSYDSYDTDHMSTQGPTVAIAFIVSDYTNNKWSRSNAPFAINPAISVDMSAIIDTYGNDAATEQGTEYLDQAEVQVGDNEPSPSEVKVVYRDADNNLTSVSLTRKAAASITVPSGVTLLDIDIVPSRLNQYTADSNSVTGMTGTVTPTSGVWVWSADLAEATGTKVLTITTSDGVTRTLNVTFASV